MVGQVMWELIEPLDKEGVFAHFLDEKGEGVHHVAVGVRDFDETVAAEARRGGELDLSGRFSGVDVAYLNIQRDLGVTIEIARGMPGDGEYPDAN
jgi:methylmalonyl-CoA/ethylmalonyl-CoA epimerase